jgi:hypothetical protein
MCLQRHKEDEDYFPTMYAFAAIACIVGIAGVNRCVSRPSFLHHSHSFHASSRGIGEARPSLTHLVFPRGALYGMI